MKISKLHSFSFPLGISEGGVFVYATNKGITIDGEVDGIYDDVDILDAHDLKNAIDDAIQNCPSLTDIDKDMFGTHIEDVNSHISYWWEVNYE